MEPFATKHAHITLSVQFGAKQGSEFVCLTSNVLASFRSKAFFPPPQLPHRQLVDRYAFKFHLHDARSTARHLILIIQSYCDTDTRYTASLLVRQLIIQAQCSLDRAGDFSLITKLGRKHKKFSVAFINHLLDEPVPSFDRTSWSYNHVTPYTYDITTQTLMTTHTTPESNDDMTSTINRTITHSPDDTEFRGHSALKPSVFFGIPHTLTGDITHASVKCLTAIYARLKETKQTRYSIITLQMLLRSLDISVCGYNSLCNQIPFDKCLQFDKALHAKYIKDTKHTVTQPAHDRHELHILSLILTQLEGRARELDIRLNSPIPTNKYSHTSPASQSDP